MNLLEDREIFVFFITEAQIKSLKNSSDLLSKMYVRRRRVWSKRSQFLAQFRNCTSTILEFRKKFGWLTAQVNVPAPRRNFDLDK